MPKLIIIGLNDFIEYVHCQNVGYFNMLDYDSWRDFTSLSRGKWFEIIKNYERYEKMYGEQMLDIDLSVTPIRNMDDISEDNIYIGMLFRDVDGQTFEIYQSFIADDGKKMWLGKTQTKFGTEYAHVFYFSHTGKLYKHI